MRGKSKELKNLSDRLIGTKGVKHGKLTMSTTGKELYHSTDSGVNYDTVQLIEESYGIGFGKAADGKDSPAIYLSAKIDAASGFYRSDDGGINWVRINDDRQRFGGADLIIGDPRVYGRVYIGTHGRGILYGEPK